MNHITPVTSGNITTSGLTLRSQPEISPDFMKMMKNNLMNVTSAYTNVTIKDENLPPGTGLVYTAADVVRKWAIFAPIILGLIFNGLCVAVMRRPLVRGSVVSFYLTFLAFADSLFLIAHPLRMIYSYTGFPVHQIPCLIFKFARSLAFGLSSWIITIVAIERCLVVLFPFKAKNFSNRKKAKITSMIIILVNVLFASPDVFTAININSNRGCPSQPMFRFYEVNIRFTLMGILTSYLPLTIIILCNVLLIWKIAAAKHARKSLSAGKQNQTGYDITKFTTAAVVMCLTFLFLTAPSMIIFLLEKIYSWRANKTYEREFLRHLATLVTLIRAAVNGFICICCSKTFRSEMVKMFSRNSAT